MNALEIIEKLRAENAKLQEENALLKTHAPYGILTRAAFEMEKRKFIDGQYVVFGDVDAMHQMNTRYGYQTVNQKIRRALEVRSDDLLLTGLYFSGDEIVFIVKGDPEGFCNRLQNSFVKHNLSITLAHAQIVAGDMDKAIEIAAQDVQEQKRTRK